MKFLLFFLLPLTASAQQDFDYTLYTRHSQFAGILNKDSSMMALAVERRIVKEESRLFIVPCMNTGNAQEYKIQYLGVRFEKLSDSLPVLSAGKEMTSFEYITEDKKYTLSIWPTIPLLEIHDANSGKLYGRYY